MQSLERNKRTAIVETPRVGVAALILHQNKVLIGRRVKQPMIASWQLPGGWLAAGQVAEDAAIDKARAFNGMQFGTVHFVAMTDNHFNDGLHTISLYYRIPCLNAEKVDLNSNAACSEWAWCDWSELPENLFLPLAILKASGFKP